MSVLLAILLQAATPTPTPTPSAEAVALGTRLARTGTLATIAPLLAAKDTGDLIAAHPELNAAEQAKLRDAAAKVQRAASERLAAAFGQAYAARLSVADLRTLVAAAEAPAQARFRASLPTAMAEAMAQLGGIDFKRDTLAAFCRETGKLCEAPPAK